MIAFNVNICDRTSKDNATHRAPTSLLNRSSLAARMTTDNTATCKQRATSQKFGAHGNVVKQDLNKKSRSVLYYFSKYTIRSIYTITFYYYCNNIIKPWIYILTYIII